MSDFIKESIKRINCLNAEIDALYHHSALKLGMSDSALFVLYSIYEHSGNILLSDIYKQSGISKQTVNSSIRALEKENILYLENVDKKSKIVMLTEKGKEYSEKTVGILCKAECDAFSCWKKEEISNYIKLFERYRDEFSVRLDNLPAGDKF